MGRSRSFWRRPARTQLILLLSLFLLLAPSAAMAAPAAQGGVYVVQPGDTLSSIAVRFGVSQSTLAQVNGISNANFVWVGQRLQIPGGSDSPAPDPGPVPSTGTYIVQAGDTLAAIAGRYGVTLDAIARANGLYNTNFIWVGQRLIIPGGSNQPIPDPEPDPEPPPASGGGTHIVQVGDTLASIARRYGTTINALVAANRLANPNFIWVGQRLSLSGSGNTVPNPPPGPGTGAGRWIDVDLTYQRLTAYEGQTAVFSSIISSGLPATPTVVGRFAVYTKLSSQTMSGPGYWLPDVPYVMYFYGGYAIHGTYWHNNFGQPMSHGCVNMTTTDAAWLFGWASIGTPVVTHY